MKRKNVKLARLNSQCDFAAVQLRPPTRLGPDSELQVYAVYADEIDCPAGEESVSWMLLTSEPVTTVEEALTHSEMVWLSLASGRVSQALKIWVSS